jgi:hypothetical protein
MINEEITQKDINLAVRIGSITATELKKALEKLIAKLQEIKDRPPEQPQQPKDPELKHGKQTLKELHKHNEGLSSIELKDPELRRLQREMKRKDIDFSVVKDGKGKYTLFFKGKNADEMTNAFKRYTEKMVTIADKKTIKADLKAAKAAAKALDAGRDKVKNRTKGARDI